MKILCTLQTRYNSSRLPGKACIDINGLPLIWHIYRRLLCCKEVDAVCLAIGPENHEPILDVADHYGMQYVVGPEPERNLLSRIILAARLHKADAVLRVRGDCLFLDPDILDSMIRSFKTTWPIVRGLTNWPKRYCSEGLDAELFGMELLLHLDRQSMCDREDFATYAIERRLIEPHAHKGMGGVDLHMSIDTQDDAIRAGKILKRIGNNCFNYESAVEAFKVFYTDQVL